MDIISHGLWGGVALGRKKNKKQFIFVLVLSMLPDLLSIGVMWVCVFLGISPAPQWNGMHLDYTSLPSYVDPLYNLTHSLIFFAVIYFGIWWVLKKQCKTLRAWGLHILIDIPSHSFIAFPTPFLWPLSNYRYDGVSWVDPTVMLPNIITLAVVYGGYLLYRKQKDQQPDMLEEMVED